MGLFTNTESYNEYEVPVVEGYEGINGRVSMMLEACQDDMNFFKTLINNDVAELNAVREGADLQVLAENAITDAWNKLKEFVKKVWAKIKSLVKAFIARVEGFVAKDGKAYVKKYNAVALKNIADGRCKKIKFKIRPVKSGANAKAIIGHIDDSAKAVDYNHPYVEKLIKEQLDSADVKEEIIKDYYKMNCDVKEFRKEILDALFDDEEEFEGIETKDIVECKLVLEGHKDAVKELKKYSNTVDKTFRDMLKRCDSAQKEADKYIGTKEGEKATSRRAGSLSNDEEGSIVRGSDETATNVYAAATKQVSACRTILTAMQDLSTTAIGAVSDAISIEFKQARKVMALAASAAGRKKVNESVEDDLALDFILDEEAAFAVDAFMA